MSDNILTDFIGEDGWFNRKYMQKLSFRFPTFKTALNLFVQFDGRAIVETGCAWVPDDFGSGQSTVIFCEVLNRYGGHLWSLDINPDHIAVGERLTQQFTHLRTLICTDSVSHLKSPSGSFPDRIDLLYLDSYDFPLGEILVRHGGGQQQALAELQATPEEDVVRRYGSLFLECQEHCLAELMAARPRLHGRAIVLIDDSRLPGGGKARLAKKELIRWGWTCLFDSQQTLWFQA